MTSEPIDYYLRLPYKLDIYPDENGNGYTAVVPDLPGCMTSADTLEELWPMIEEAKRLWLEVALEDHEPIPEPAPIRSETYSGRFVLRVPRSLHRQLAARAKQESSSLNQLVVSLLAEAMGRWAAGALTYPAQYATATRFIRGQLLSHVFLMRIPAPTEWARFPLEESKVLWKRTSLAGQQAPAARSSHVRN